MPTEADIQAALKTVIHPTYGMSLVTLQMVRAIRLFPEHIEVDLVMNCPGCPAGQAVLARIRQTLELLCSSDGVQVVICLLPQVWKPPWQSLTQMF
jgi:metal-sulfur cluster biosynthetic enzyme